MDIREFDARLEKAITSIKLCESDRYKVYNKPGFDLYFVHKYVLDVLQDTQTIFQEYKRMGEAYIKRQEKLEEENAELRRQLEECDTAIEEEQADHLKWLEDQKIVFAGAVDYTAKKAVEAFKEILIEKIKNM